VRAVDALHFSSDELAGIDAIVARRADESA
jgi:hypothetical protein